MIITEGKTKIIRKGAKAGEVIMETKDELTGGDAAKRETIAGIAVHKTTQTVNNFKLLARKGIPTAFIRREGDCSLVCHECEMLPLELVMRRYAWGSFLKREPQLVSTHKNPHRFDSIYLEMFHKHSVVVPPNVPATVQMEEGAARGLFLKNGVWADGVYTDPLIRIEKGRWFLHSAKVPVDPKKPLLEIKPMLSETERSQLENDIMRATFEVLEKAWAGIITKDGPVALVDMKIEVGRRKSDNRLVIADVIDNDAWRIWPGADPVKQLDKQCFREDHPLSEVAEKYQLVASLTEKFATL